MLTVNNKKLIVEIPDYYSFEDILSIISSLQIAIRAISEQGYEATTICDLVVLTELLIPDVKIIKLE